MNPADEKRELEGIKYLKENNDMTNLEVVLKVYNKLVDQNVFKTKAGIGYLRELQSQLIEGNVPREKIRPIPIIDFEEEVSEPVEVKPETRPEPRKVEYVKREPIKRVEVPKKVSATTSAKTTAASADKPKKPNKYKSMYTTSLIFNIILVIVIIVMLVIAGSSSNPTILNYEEKIQDKYSSWEEDLKMRERELNQREIKSQFTE